MIEYYYLVYAIDNKGKIMPTTIMLFKHRRIAETYQKDQQKRHLKYKYLLQIINLIE